ncbi:MAG TPA: methylthioribulose 1-phosphate dehydratase [Terracidiphilus sp.]|nr:methylthioribulose 1-phosphate dehydratase [Terracidiphilus sp.]
MTDATDAVQTEKAALCATARWCYMQGWLPATSGNFSLRAGESLWMSPSGMDKGGLAPEDLLELDLEGRPHNAALKPSAETGLHVVLYRERPEARAILHVHSIWNTLLSERFAAIGYLPLEGYELLKALAGVATHTHLERVPVLENSQDYAALSRALEETLVAHPAAHGVLLNRHGLYTWGQSVAEARRHLEALEFLFEVESRRLLARQA